MRNQEERNDFIDNPHNWVISESSMGFVRILSLTYKGEVRYKLEVYQKNFHWYAGVQKEGYKTEWTLKTYYKFDEECGALEPQSLTNMRDWVADLDRKYPDRASKKALPDTLDLPRRNHGES